MKCNVIECAFNSLHGSTATRKDGHCTTDPQIKLKPIGADYHHEKNAAVCDTCTANL